MSYIQTKNIACLIVCSFKTKKGINVEIRMILLTIFRYQLQ